MPKTRKQDDREPAKGAGAAGEAMKLIVDYAKQETLGPLKGLGRFLAFGLVGAIGLSIGAMLLLLALLRALETETGSTFRGDLSWAPYLLTAAAAIAVLGLAAWRITKGPAQKRKTTPKDGA